MSCLVCYDCCCCCYLDYSTVAASLIFLFIGSLNSNRVESLLAHFPHRLIRFRHLEAELLLPAACSAASSFSSPPVNFCTRHTLEEALTATGKKKKEKQDGIALTKTNWKSFGAPCAGATSTTRPEEAVGAVVEERRRIILPQRGIEKNSPEYDKGQDDRECSLSRTTHSTTTRRKRHNLSTCLSPDP